MKNYYVVIPAAWALWPAAYDSLNDYMILNPLYRELVVDVQQTQDAWHHPSNSLCPIPGRLRTPPERTLLSLAALQRKPKEGRNPKAGIHKGWLRPNRPGFVKANGYTRHDGECVGQKQGVPV